MLMLALLAAAHNPVPTDNPASWISSDDYPAPALRAGKEGVAGVRLDVGADGAPVACTVVHSADDPDLDAASCAQLMAHARFRPATDAAGTPVAGSWWTRVRWQIPKTPLESTGFVMTLDIDPAGKVGGCDTVKLGDSFGTIDFQCDTFSNEPLIVKVLGREMTTLRRVDVRFLVQVEGTPPVAPPASYDLQVLLAAATFDVTPDGTVTNCTPEPAKAISATPLPELCEAELPKHGFAGDPAGQIRKVRVSADISAMLRAPAKP